MLPTKAIQAAALVALMSGAAALPAAAQAVPAPERLTLLRLADPAPQPMPVSSLPDITYEELIGSPQHASSYSPVALGLGAIGGVLVFNGVGSTLIGPATTAGVPLESALAASRVYAISSAVVGAFVGQWIYERVFAR